MNRSAMVHKRRPAAGDSIAATASEGFRVANINRQIAEELGVREQQVEATVALLDGGATVPFVARYRKEITGALDDAQLRTLEERLNYLRELEERRTAILNSIREQGKLDAALEAAILAADSKGRLEDIYLPFKPKRRTKAEIAKEAGLEPLAELLLTQPQNDPQAVAARVRRCRKAGRRCRRRARRRARDSGRAFRRGRRPDRRAARADVVERPDGVHRAQRQEDRGREVQGLFRFQRAAAPNCRRTASWRCSAARRKRSSTCRCSPKPVAATPAAASSYELKIMQRFAHFRSGPPRRQMAGGDRALGVAHQDPGASQHRSADAAVDRGRDGSACACSPRICATCCWRRRPARASPWASIPASAPASRSPSSMPPARWWRPPRSIRTSRSGAGTRRWRRWASSRVQHRVDLIAIGNGTASRETDKLATELVKLLPDLKMSKIVVSEAGASVYSASAFASEELPELDVTLRGAVSIARRLQDPLAELVKIDPKAIGVGQYQHDLGESQAGALARCRGRGLRQRGRRRRQHRLGAAAGAGVGHRRGPGAKHRAAPRRQRPVQVAQGAEGGAAAGAEGVRAMRRLPAHHRRRRSARCLRRASGSLSGGAADSRARPRATSRR